MNDEPTQPNDPAGEPAQPEPAQPGQQPPPQGAYYYAPPGHEQPPGTYRPVYFPQSSASPSNNSAVASIIVACTSIGVLVLTAGILAPLTLIASAVATFLGHKGKSDVDKGKTPVQRDLAVGGFWTGIGGIVLSILALIAWVAIVALIWASDPNWDGFHDPDGHHWNFD